MNTVKPNSANLKRAWAHIIKSAILGNKARAAVVLLVGIITTIFQMGAMLVLVMAARAYENKGFVDYGPVHLDLSNHADNNTFILVMGGAFLVLLASIFFGLYQQVIITRIGRKYFEETLDDTRARLRALAAKNQPYETSSFARMLQRDSRYLSIAFMRALSLLQPGLLVIVFLGFALSTTPMTSGLLVVGCILMVPAHIWMSKWSARSSEDIQAGAKLKSEEERAYISAVGTDPFVADWDKKYHIKTRAPGEDQFISAFVKRQRISAYSQFITDTAMAFIVVVMVVILAQRGGGELLSLTNIMILLILFRLIMSYVGKFAQAATMVSSFEPFFRELLDLRDGKFAAASARKPNLKGEMRSPKRLVACQINPLSRCDGQFYSDVLGLNSPVFFVRANYDLTGRKGAIKIPDDLVLKGAFSADTELEGEINSFLQDGKADLSERAKYMLAFLAALKADDALILCDGAMWDKLEKSDLRFIMSALQERALVIIHHRPPGKLILPPRFQVCVRSSDELKIVGTIETYRDVRPQIVNTLQDERKMKIRQNEGLSANEVETF